MARELPCNDWNGDNDWAYAHLKRDGIWVTLERHETGCRALSRTPRDITKDVYWHPTYKSLVANSLPGTTIFCEAYVVGGCREDVKGAFKSRSDKLQIDCFAIKQLNGEHLSLRQPLEDLQLYCHGLQISFVPFYTREDLEQSIRDDAVRGQSPNVDRELLLILSKISGDAEGWVLKDGNLCNWRKVKPEYTYDFVIMGFSQAEPGSKFDGLIGSIILADGNNVEVTRASGMTDETRRHMTENEDKYIGKLCEIACQGVGSAGGIMHPRFVRMRDDKPAGEADVISK